MNGSREYIQVSTLARLLFLGRSSLVLIDYPSVQFCDIFSFNIVCLKMVPEIPAPIGKRQLIYQEFSLILNHQRHIISRNRQHLLWLT